MKTFQEMLGPDCGRNIDRQISAIVGEFHRNVEQLCKEEFDRFALANGYVKLEPGQVVVDAEDANTLLEYWFANQMARESGCGEIGNAARRIRDAIKEARDDR